MQGRDALGTAYGAVTQHDARRYPHSLTALDADGCEELAIIRLRAALR